MEITQLPFNAVKRRAWMFKNNLIPGLASMKPEFLINIWDEFTQANIAYLKYSLYITHVHEIISICLLTQ